NRSTISIGTVKVIEVALVGSLVVVLTSRAATGREPQSAQPLQADPVLHLALEVRDKGWIAYGARTAKGDWDLFVCRPEVSSIRKLSQTSEFNEAAPQFSRDGRKLLYRRLPREENIDGNRYGEQGELVIANSDGSDPRVFGKPGEYAWASWSPDGTRM